MNKKGMIIGLLPLILLIIVIVIIICWTTIKPSVVNIQARLEVSKTEECTLFNTKVVKEIKEQQCIWYGSCFDKPIGAIFKCDNTIYYTYNRNTNKGWHTEKLINYESIINNENGFGDKIAGMKAIIGKSSEDYFVAQMKNKHEGVMDSDDLVIATIKVNDKETIQKINKDVVTFVKNWAMAKGDGYSYHLYFTLDDDFVPEDNDIDFSKAEFTEIYNLLPAFHHDQYKELVNGKEFITNWENYKTNCIKENNCPEYHKFIYAITVQGKRFWGDSEDIAVIHRLFGYDYY